MSRTAAEDARKTKGAASGAAAWVWLCWCACASPPEDPPQTSETTGGSTTPTDSTRTEGPSGDVSSSGAPGTETTIGESSIGESTTGPTGPQSCVNALFPKPGPWHGSNDASLAVAGISRAPAGPDAFEDETPHGASFLNDPDVGPDFECSTFAQNCPPTQKCNPWADDGGGSWNSTRCTAVAQNPVGVGETCTVEGSGVSGIDNCEIGVMCFDVDGETNEGTCVPLCSGSPAAPVCPADLVCTITNNNTLALCLPICNPLVPTDCAPGNGCYLVQGQFTCAPDASGQLGEPGDPCEFINACDPGNSCVSAELVPGCVGSSCCTPFCDVLAPECPDGSSCADLFSPGDAPAACVENVGLCGPA